MVKVGDIIDGRRVTRVYVLCGSQAYESEPVLENTKYFPEEPKKIDLPEKEETTDVTEEDKPRRGRRRKEA